MTCRLDRWSERLTVLASSAVIVLATASGGCGERPATQKAAQSTAVSRKDSPQQSPLDPARVANLENSLRAIEDGLKESARDRWDPDYVVQQVGTDPQRLFEWVRDNTYWIPYRGALRGPVGVLNDRLGNSLDRAVLLATLLRKAGHNVRLAHRELGAEEGFQLATAAAIGASVADESVDLAESEVEDVEDVQASDAEIRAVAAEYHLDAARVERTLTDRAQAVDMLIADLDARVADQTQRLLGAIGDTPATEEWMVRFDAAVTAVRDHWWVQRQEGETWLDLDVLASEQAATKAAGPTETAMLSELAPMQHELALRVIAERWSNGTTSERQAMEHVWRPSETIGQPIVLQFWPADWRTDETLAASDPEQGFRTMALEQQQWNVVLSIGNAVVSHATLTASGDLFRPQRGGAFGGIAGSFGQSQSDAPGPSNPVLTAVWLEYEIRSPGRPPQLIRRQVFDLLGPAARAGKQKTFALNVSQRLARSLSLMMRTEILPMSCALSTEYVGDLAARSLLADRNLLLAAARGEIALGTPQTDKLLNDAAPAFSPLYTLALARFDWSRRGEQIFIDRLNVLARHRFLASTSDGLVVREATDIVANEVGVDLAALDAFAIRVEQGVFDTNAERVLQVSGRPLGNTAAAYEASTDWITLRARDGLDQLKLSADARRNIGNDLDAGYAVVTSPRPITIGTEPFVGWWRIDSATGHTLGIADTGWGQDMAERGVQYSVFTEVAKRFAFDYLLCRVIPVVADAADVPIVKEFFPIETPEKAHSGCLISALASGAIFATLPLFLASLKYLRPFLGPLGRLKLPRWAPKPPGVPKPPRMRPPCIR